MTPLPDPAEIGMALARHGLRLRGGFAIAAGEDAPSGPGGAAARSVLLVGHAGGEMWPHFTAWLAVQPDGLPDPLDRWSKFIIGTVAQSFAARPVFPSDAPYMPFQQWAMRAEGLQQSPLGILMHPEFGLWHAFRGALLFDVSLEIPELAHKVSHACDSCAEKPCLSACPVSAFASGRFAVDACRSHVRSDAGEVCGEAGCMARNACPVGVGYRYSPDQQAFHQHAFARL